MREAIIITTCLLGAVFAGSPRLPRTSADERNTRNVSNNGGNVAGNTMPASVRNSQRNRYVGLTEEMTTETSATPVTPTTIVSSSVSMSMSSSTSSNIVPVTGFNNSNIITAGLNNSINSTVSPGVVGSSSTSQRSSAKNRGVIFPSVKNKPSPANSTFTTDAFLSFKDVKVGRVTRALIY